MRQLVLAAGAVCAAAVGAGRADAQGTTMPGQMVGTGLTYNLSPVGSQLGRAAPPAGEPINIPADSPLMRRYDPNNPYAALEGTSLTRDQIVVPLGTELSMMDKLKSLIGMTKVVQTQPQSGYFPSLTRRNRERAEQRMWRRD